MSALFDTIFGRSRPATTLTLEEGGNRGVETRPDGSTRRLERTSNGSWQQEQPIQLVNEENLTAAQRAEIARENAKDTAGSRAAEGKSTNDETSGTSPSPPPPFNWADAPKPSTAVQEPGLETLNASQRDRSQSSGPTIAQAFNINSFRSEMLENEVLPSHTYLVTFAPFRDVPTLASAPVKENAPLTNFVTNKRNTLVMRCENIVLPTASLLEEENIRRYGYGPVEKVPYGVQFSDVTMTWIVDKNSEIIDFFHQWMNTIVMHDSPNSLMAKGFTRPGLQNYNPFEVGYKDSYANPIVRIYVYNRQNEITTEYEMYDVFPMNIQSMNLGWADENQVQKLTVTFAYVNMRVQTPKKTTTQQLNFLLEGKNVNFFTRSAEEDQFIRDFADSPLSERFTRTMNKSNPTIKDPQDFSDVAATPPTPQPTVRTV